MKLEGKVAIVTGASRGIGKAIAIGFAREGADIIIAARTEVERKEIPGTIYATAEEIHSLGRRVLPVRCDITNEQDVEALVNKVLDELGRVDILVNNAGIAYPSPILEIPVKRWDIVMSVNVRGTFLCTKAVLPKMVEQGSGNILNITSNAANRKIKSPTGAVYCVSKAAIDAFTWQLAAELGEYNIAVNALKPRGAIATEGMQARNPDQEWWSQWDSPDLMVKAAIFLAVQDASGITGVVATDEEICSWHGLL